MAKNDHGAGRNAGVSTRLSPQTYREIRYIAAVTNLTRPDGKQFLMRDLIDSAWATFKAQHPEIRAQLQRAEASGHLAPVSLESAEE